MTRYAAKVDANQAEIIQALRDHGCEVLDMSDVGGGFPDIMVWIPAWSRWILIEIKVPGANLNKTQVKWHEKYKNCMVFVVRSAEEALSAVAHFEG